MSNMRHKRNASARASEFTRLSNQQKTINSTGKTSRRGGIRF